MSTKPSPSASGTASGTASGSKSSSHARLADTKLCHGTIRGALAVSLSIRLTRINWSVRASVSWTVDDGDEGVIYTAEKMDEFRNSSSKISKSWACNVLMHWKNIFLLLQISLIFRCTIGLLRIRFRSLTLSSVCIYISNLDGLQGSPTKESNSCRML